MKRILGLMLICCMVFAVLTVTANADGTTAPPRSGICGSNLTWVLDEEGTLTISGTGAMNDYQPYMSWYPWYIVRNEIKTVVVENGCTSIGNSAFFDCGNITDVKIADSVYRVGEAAFMSCDSLRSITMPNRSCTFDEGAFSGCDISEVHIKDLKSWLNYTYDYSSYPFYFASEGKLYLNGTLLTEVVIPKEVKSINAYAFAECSSIKSVTIPENVESIHRDAFANCENLTDVTMADGVKLISEQAFLFCTNLTNVTLSNSLETIGSNAFNGCNSLKSIVFPESLIRIDEWAFNDCTGLEKIIIPESVIYLGNGAFGGCTSLKSIDLMGSIEFGGTAFRNCTSVTSVTISDSITYIPEGEFRHCNNLRDVYYLGSESDWRKIEIGSYNEPLYSATIHFAEESIEEVASGTCGDNLTWVLDENGTLTISGTGAMDDYAEDNAPWNDYKNNIVNVIIEDGVTGIGHSAFSFCMVMTDITIPDSVTSIGAHAFWCCESLTSIHIPAGVTHIGGEETFGDCISMTGIWVDENNAYYASDSKGVLFNKDKTELIYAPDMLSGSYDIPDSVIAICDDAFTDCYSLTSVNIPEGVMSIGDCAFWGCALTEIIIPDSVTSIGEGAFWACEFTSIVIPSGITTIKNTAFGACFELTEVTIPNSVTVIEESAFGGCENLTDIYFSGTEEEWNNITIADFNEELTSATIHFAKPAESEYAPGDIGLDGEITNSDLITLARYIVDYEDLTEAQLAVADINADGEVSNSDLVMLARIIVGLD